MADIRNPETEDLTKAVEGLSYLVTGFESDAGGMAGAQPNAVLPILKQLGNKLNANTRPQGRPGADGNLKAADQPKGARDTLKDIAVRFQSGTALNAPEISALESALYYSGNNVTFDGAISEGEKLSLFDFTQDYLNDPAAKLNELQTRNIALANGSDVLQGTIDTLVTADAQAKADAEAARLQAEAEAKAAVELAAAQEQAAKVAAQEYRDSRFDSGLVYAGYLDPAKVGDLDSRHKAMWNLMLDHQYQVIDGEHDLDDRMREYFGADGKSPVSEAGIAQMIKLTSGTDALPPEFKADLESGDANRIALAQNYMGLKGHTIAPSEIGTMSQDTFDTANAMLRNQISTPSSLYYEDGSGLNYGQVNVLANSGQLLLPADADLAKYLNEDERAALKLLPSDFMTREEFIATAMLDDTDGTAATYGKFVDDYNAAHNNVTLNVKVELPTIALNSDEAALIIPASLGTAAEDGIMTPLEEHAALSNPVGVKKEDLTVLGGSSDLGELVHNAAVGTLTDGTLAFDQSQRDLITSTYADAFTQYAGVNGGVTMYDALRISHSLTTTDNEMFLDGASPGGGDAPSVQEAGRIQEELNHDLGRDTDHQFLTVLPGQPGFDRTAYIQDMNLLLQGTFAYENKQALAQLGGGNYVQNYLTASASDPAVKELQGSITRVAQGTPIVDGTMYALGPKAPEMPVKSEIEVATDETDKFDIDEAKIVEGNVLGPVTTIMSGIFQAPANGPTGDVKMTQQFGQNAMPELAPVLPKPDMGLGMGPGGIGTGMTDDLHVFKPF